MSVFGKIVKGALVATAVAVVGFAFAIWRVTSHYDAALERVALGSTTARVIAIFGEPAMVEYPGKPFLRYATSGCTGRCAKRLWFENWLAPGIEAWSLELDAEDRVIRKTHWVFP